MGYVGFEKRKSPVEPDNDEEEPEEEEDEKEEQSISIDNFIDVSAVKRMKRGQEEGSPEEEQEEEDESDDEEEEDGRSKPRFWTVKCKHGLAEDAAASIFAQINDSESTAVLVKCAIAPDKSCEGIVIIEAESEAHIRKACQGLNLLLLKKITPVSDETVQEILRNENREVLVGESSRSACEFSVKDWVRVKGGIYNGDIAQVVEVRDHLKKLRVKLVPRIDVCKYKTKGFHLKKNKPGLFTPEHAQKLGFPVKREKGRTVCKSSRMEFWDGYLITLVQSKSVTAITPTKRELDFFMDPHQIQEPDEEEDLRPKKKARKTKSAAKGKAKEDAGKSKGKAKARSDAGKSKAYVPEEPRIHDSSLKKDEKVQVIDGELRGTIGRVTKVDGDAVYVLADDRKFVRAHKNQLERVYEVANHIRVASGEHEGRTGMIVKLESDHVVLRCDLITENIEVPRKCLGEVLTPSEISAGQFNEGDLVLIDQSTFGIILKIEGADNSVEILKGEIEQEVVNVKARNIQKKLVDENATARDATSKIVRLDSMVRVQEGPLSESRGTVKHIYQDFLFVHNADHADNQGNFCAHARSCVLEEVKGFLMANFKTGAPPRKTHELVGKEVKVTRGSYKGLKGRVVRAYRNIVHVFLRALLKEVTVEAQIIASLDGTALQQPRGGRNPRENGDNGGGWNADDGGGGWNTGGDNGGGVTSNDGGGWNTGDNGGGGWNTEDGGGNGWGSGKTRDQNATRGGSTGEETPANAGGETNEHGGGASSGFGTNGEEDDRVPAKGNASTGGCGGGGAGEENGDGGSSPKKREESSSFGWGGGGTTGEIPGASGSARDLGWGGGATIAGGDGAGVNSGGW
ncbi:putative transcription elongation factor SPT5 homolog 1 [Selaginella moellendorffii]|uniref:putative transcription elongation factor SPT5 homolog 1 n=1 Tax=Selaginella moellendorffii TaxID=88036 RepID=UPI000D1CF62D|nr:putative transcription elongation factor SPT5 homolog 1 [Selaginella moellendorffii]|eukprot:XP_024544661.1 putative transcription elongation factor SPT5 homolog 1 [Selaginella moellendorffii]